MLRLQTKIAALKSIKSSTSPYQLLIKRVPRTSSASYQGNFHNLSSSFSPKSTSSISNRKRALAKPSENNSKSLPNTANQLKFNVNQAKSSSNDTFQSSSLIHSLRSLAKKKNCPEAIYCYKKFAASFSRFPSNFFILNILLNSYCNLKLASGCGFSVFGVILKKGFSPNTVTFTSLVKGLCLEEKTGQASKLFRKMIRLGFYPNVVTCTALITGLCNAGNSKAALDLHTEMLNGKLGFGYQRCDPNLVSYGSLINGVCKIGLLVKAKELLLEMRSRGISPNVVVYTSLINGFCLSGRWEEARLIFQEMVDDGVQANEMTLHSVLRSLCRQGRANKAIEMYAQGGNYTDLVHKVIVMEIGRK